MVRRIEFPKICGAYSFEKLLLDQKKDPTDKEAVEFDLTSCVWMGALEVSLLYDWVAQLIAVGHPVKVDLLNENDPTLAHYFSRIGFISALKEIGSTINAPRVVNTNSELAAFQNFQTREQLVAYESSVSDLESSDRILGGGGKCDLIASGDFREIILHELGENAFSHGNGESVRYFIREVRARKTSDEFSFPPEIDFLEVVVSDSGPGLISKLRRELPTEWEPTNSAKSNLTIGGRTCAFALEFSATSDPSARQKRLQDQFNSSADFADVIPTGLFYVASLVRHYRGQMQIRTAQTSFLLDCTSDSTGVVRENPLGKQGAKVRGTSVLVRVPRQARHRSLPRPSGVELETFPISPESAEALLVADIWQQAKYQSADFLVYMEAAVEAFFSSTKSKGNDTLVLVADGFQPDTKTAAWLLTWLGAIPRRGHKVLVCGLQAELFAAARDQSNVIRNIRRSNSKLGATHRFQGWQSFHISSSSSEHALAFGQSTETFAAPREVGLAHQHALRRVLERVISTSPIRHVEQLGRFYLIEGKYYTTRFYEIRQLTSRHRNPLGVRLVTSYLRALLRQLQTKAVYCIADSLKDVVVELSRECPDVHFLQAEETSVGFLQLASRVPKDSTLLILTDVVCTGRQFQPLLKRVPRINDVRLFALVDAREVEYKSYFTVQLPDKAYTVPALSILDTTIPAIVDLRYSGDADILIVDRVTHAPTPRDDLQNIHFGPDEVITESASSDALLQGHIVVDDVHYVDLIQLPRLLSSLYEEMAKAWGKVLRAIQERGTEARHVSVFYLAEDRGWEFLVDRYMATKGIAECRSIDRARLDAPPARQESAIRGSTVLLILPVIASGETLRKCLEYFSRLTTIGPQQTTTAAPSIFIWVALGRAPSSELSFYQGIRRFKGAHVQIDVMAYLPLPAYRGKAACPVCQLTQAVRANTTRLRGRQAPLLIESAGLPFLPVDFSPHEIATTVRSKADASARGRAILRSLFSEADRDIPRRKELAEKLDSDEWKHLFLEMVGSHADPATFREDVVRLRLYNRFDSLQMYALKTIARAKTQKCTLCALVGLHILFPVELENELKLLTLSACQRGDSEQLADLLFVTMIDPVRYGPLFSVGVLAARHQGECMLPRALLDELAGYHTWIDAHIADAIDSFEMVLWLLRRSTDWGSRIESLRALLNVPGVSKAEIASRFHDLELKGINVVLRNMAIIETADRQSGLLTAIASEGTDPSPLVQAIMSSTDEFRSLLGSASESFADLSKSLSNLDRTGKALRDACDQLFTNPLSAIREVEAMIPQRWPELRQIFNLESSIAPDQPGILFGLRDLSACLAALVENVAEHVKATNSSAESSLWLRLSFLGMDKKSDRAILEVHDNIPYSRPLVPSGGLKTFAANCAKYGATVDFSPRHGSDTALRIRLYFRIDYSKRAI